MPKLSRPALVAALFVSTSVSAQSIPANDVQALAWIDKRLSALEAETRDRSTPERALRSYFKHMNNKSEIQCLSYEAQRRAQGPRRSTFETIDKHIDRIREGFFGGLPLEYFQHFKNETFAECLAGAESYSYEIISSEPAADGKVRIVIHSRNTTPLTAAMKPDEYDAERRSEGFTFRFEFQKEGSEWKIVQIEDKEFSDDWKPKFTPDDLDPLVPAQVWVDML